MAMSKAEITEKSEAIFRHWQAPFPINSLHYIHLFLSIDKFNEVNTNPFLHFIQSLAPHTLPVVPVTDFEQDVLTHIAISPEIELAENDWGIPEPKIQKTKIAPSQLDMVLVPMLGFDLALNRLGYGKGFYDQFLAQTRPDCKKIGLCLEMGKVSDGIPTQPHDFPLDAVVTESGVYWAPDRKIG